MQLQSLTLEVEDTQSEVFSFPLLANFHSETLSVQILLFQAEKKVNLN